MPRPSPVNASTYPAASPTGQHSARRSAAHPLPQWARRTVRPVSLTVHPILQCGKGTQVRVETALVRAEHRDADAVVGDRSDIGLRVVGPVHLDAVTPWPRQMMTAYSPPTWTLRRQRQAECGADRRVQPVGGGQVGA